MRNRHKWSERLPCIQEEMGIKMADIPATQAAVCRGPWLRRSAGERFGLTCVTCNCAIPADTATELQTCNLLHHHRSARHIDNAKAVRGILVGPNRKPIAGAPTAAEFRSVWDMAGRGTAPAQGLDNIGHAHKLRRMQFCIYEAMARADSAFFTECYHRARSR